MPSVLPPNAPLKDRLRSFAEYLDERMTRIDKALAAAPKTSDVHVRCRICPLET
jgi:hypothetical protein